MNFVIERAGDAARELEQDVDDRVVDPDLAQRGQRRAVTAGLRCAPETLPIDCTSMNSTKPCTRPDDREVGAAAPPGVDEQDTATLVTKKTSANVPMNSAT